MSTCNRLDLETLGSRLILPKNLPRRMENIVTSTHTNSVYV